MGGLQITEVVKNLLIINVLMFIGTFFLMGTLQQPAELFGTTVYRGMLALYYPASEAFRPYQLVTHMFMHAGVNHLLFNMIGLFFFGPPLEQRFGPKKFLFYYLSCGFGAMLLHLLVLSIEIYYLGSASVNSSMWGASGAIFGLVMGFVMLYPNQTIHLLIPPIPMKAKYFGALYMGLELFLGFSGYGSNIAHFAHLGGAIVGMAIVWIWRRQGL